MLQFQKILEKNLPAQAPINTDVFYITETGKMFINKSDKTLQPLGCTLSIVDKKPIQATPGMLYLLRTAPSAPGSTEELKIVCFSGTAWFEVPLTAVSVV